MEDFEIEKRRVRQAGKSREMNLEESTTKKIARIPIAIPSAEAMRIRSHLESG